MRKVGEMAVAAAARLAAESRPSTECERQTEKPSKAAATLWLRMTEIYGHRWTSAHGETPTALWSTALSGLSGDQVKRGLLACLTNGDAWPPSLPEFLAWCRPPARENAAAYRAVPMLPAPVSSPERAKQELQQIRQRLEVRR